jgi:hypothetical protein
MEAASRYLLKKLGLDPTKLDARLRFETVPLLRLLAAPQALLV